MLSLNDNDNSNLMVTTDIEVFVLYIDKNTKPDSTIEVTNTTANTTARRELFSLQSS